MTNKATVDDFLAQHTLALVGASRDPKAFSSNAYKELTEKGYRLIPVNPKAENVMGERCYPSLRDLPEPVGGALDHGVAGSGRSGGARCGRSGHQASMDAAGRRV